MTNKDLGWMIFGLKLMVIAVWCFVLGARERLISIEQKLDRLLKNVPEEEVI